MNRARRQQIVASIVLSLGLACGTGCLAYRAMRPVPVPDGLRAKLLDAPGVVIADIPHPSPVFFESGGDPSRVGKDSMTWWTAHGHGVLLGENTLLVTAHQALEPEGGGGTIVINGRSMEYCVERRLSDCPEDWAVLRLSQPVTWIPPAKLDAHVPLPPGTMIYTVFYETVPVYPPGATDWTPPTHYKIQRQVVAGRVLERVPLEVRLDPLGNRLADKVLHLSGDPRLKPGTSGSPAFYWPPGEEAPVCIGIAIGGLDPANEGEDETESWWGVSWIRRPHELDLSTIGRPNSACAEFLKPWSQPARHKDRLADGAVEVGGLHLDGQPYRRAYREPDGSTWMEEDGGFVEAGWYRSLKKALENAEGPTSQPTSSPTSGPTE